MGLSPDALTATKQTEYVRKLRERLHYAYTRAQEAAKRSAAGHKAHYDRKVRESVLHPGDRVLVRNVGLRGKQKLADRWERQAYIVKCQPNPDIPVYEVQLENSRSRKKRTLHRNLLLPFMFIPRMKQQQLGSDSENAVQVDEEQEIDNVAESDTESLSETESQTNEPRSQTPRYVIPMRRPPGTPALNPRTQEPVADVHRDSRPVREQRKPQWMTSNHWVLAQQQSALGHPTVLPAFRYNWYPFQ